MTITDEDREAAALAGQLAAHGGLSYRSCPFNANGDVDHRVLTAHFIHAYILAGGSVPVSYDQVDDDEDVDMQPPPPGDDPGQVYPWVP